MTCCYLYLQPKEINKQINKMFLYVYYTLLQNEIESRYIPLLLLP